MVEVGLATCVVELVSVVVEELVGWVVVEVGLATCVVKLVPVVGAVEVG